MISKLRVSVPPLSRLFLIRSDDQWLSLGIAAALSGLVYVFVLAGSGSDVVARSSAIGAMTGALSAFVFNFDCQFDWDLGDQTRRRWAESELTKLILDAGYKEQREQGYFCFPDITWHGFRVMSWLIWRSNAVRISKSSSRLTISAPLFFALVLRRSAVRLSSHTVT